MKEQLIHILDQSVCLSRRQMRDYLSSSMEQEEQHAVEIHLVACPLCGMAMDGFETKPAEALTSLNDLNSRFLKAHFDTLVPQIHLNSMAPASAMSSAKPLRPSQVSPSGRHVVVISLLAGVLAAIWYYEFGRNTATSNTPEIRSSAPITSTPEPQPARAAIPAVAAPAKQKSQVRIHPQDEALIQEAKAMNAQAPVELSDDELTKIFNESSERNGSAEPVLKENEKGNSETTPENAATSGKQSVTPDSGNTD